jgi:prolyl 4-hydroxylase
MPAGTPSTTRTHISALRPPPRAARPAEERLIGWRGETHRLPHGRVRNASAGAGADGGMRDDQLPWAEALSWRPRALAYHNVISDGEARRLMRLAVPTMKRSTVVGANGSSVEDNYRTSYGTFVRRNSDPLVTALAARIAAWVGVDPRHAEDLQVLRYGVGQYYHQHMDVLQNDQAGPRVATVLVYFMTPDEGGETSFPSTGPDDWLDPAARERFSAELSACAKGHVAVKPRRGDALAFWSIQPDGRSQDGASMHEGCPVVRGVKWTGTLWFHAKPFRPESYEYSPDGAPPDPGTCTDSDARCADWAASGECEKNPSYMLGGASDPGMCRRSCKACVACAGPEDRACYDENRRRAGYLVLNAEELEAVRGDAAAAPPR